MSHGFGEKRVFKIQTAMQFVYSMQVLIDSIHRGELPNRAMERTGDRRTLHF
jgi:hypothetical protein